MIAISSKKFITSTGVILPSVNVFMLSDDGSHQIRNVAQNRTARSSAY